MEGSISTLLSVLPLAFHPMIFIVKYLFGIIALVVLIGILNGVVFMPALLALLSPILSKCGQGKNLEEFDEQTLAGQSSALPQSMPTVLESSQSSSTADGKKYVNC